MHGLSIVTTVKAPVSTICHFLDYHIGLGVCRFYLFFDDSDGVASKFIGDRYANRVVTFDCTQDYWTRLHGFDRPDNVERRQRLNADLALSLARRHGDEWISHIDVDEYIFIDKGDLESLLKGVEKDNNIIRMDVLEAIPSSINTSNIFDIRHFKSLPFYVEIGNSSYSLSCRLRRSALFLFYRCVFLLLGKILRVPSFRSGLYNFYNAHWIGKSIVRVTEEVVSLRLHFPWFAAGMKVRVYTTTNCATLHFESCTYSEWLEKWLRRSTDEGFAAALDDRQRSIFGSFLDCSMDEKKLKRLYANLYIYQASQLELFRRLGLVREIDMKRRVECEG